jgi:hypothetical protein
MYRSVRSVEAKLKWSPVSRVRRSSTRFFSHTKSDAYLKCHDILIMYNETRGLVNITVSCKNMNKIGYYLTFLGIVLFAYSFTLNAYIDEAAYTEAYHSIDRTKLGRETSFREFYDLRDRFLTNKFRYQDYGATFSSLGLFLIFLVRKGWKNITSPNASWKIVLLGFSAALLTTAGYIGDTFLEFFRGSYPPWADSLGIPLSGVSILFIIFFGWAAINMVGLSGKFSSGASISNIGVRRLNWWYGILAIITSLITLLCVYDGFFWLVLPGLLWLYFYLSIMAGRKAANQANPRAELSSESRDPLERGEIR